MKRVFILLMCLFAMLSASLSVKAQEVTITLFPGWTWISYPKTEAMDIATALGDFVPVEGDIINSQYSSATYRNGQWRGRLQQFTPGLGYMYYSMRGEPVTLVFGGSTPQSQVTVTTSEPLLITAISAMGGGEVTSNDGTYIIVKGLCWATHENPMTNDDFYQEAGSGVGTFSISMTELNIATTYYVRAYAVTPNGTVYGDQKSFTTRDGIPTLTTDTVTNITGATAICGGTVTDNGGLNVTARGVCWSTSQNPTVSDSHTTNGSGLGSFTSSIAGLSVSTTYYVRAYATTSAGTGYGEEVSFTTRDGIPEVITAEISNTDVMGSYAMCGGMVTDNGGLNVSARGICWGTNHNPTINDNYTTDGSGLGSFISRMTGLTLTTTYYVRAYASTNQTTSYGEEKSFTTLENEYTYVDLGLPSGTLWATCNVGAEYPEAYGDYYAWGETQPKSIYNWSNYQYCNGSWNTLTKYCTDSSYGNNGFTDNLTTLLPEDDVATVNWGTEWRMPTKEEWQELSQNTTHNWAFQNGVIGLLFTASNGNSLFLPHTFFGEDSYDDEDGIHYYDYYIGEYWSSSLDAENPDAALELYSYMDNYWENPNYYYLEICSRCYKRSVRPVRCKNSVINVTVNSSEGGSVSGGGTYMEQTSCTVTATANEGYVFTYWTENGEVVSTNSSYTFIVLY